MQIMNSFKNIYVRFIFASLKVIFVLLPGIAFSQPKAGSLLLTPFNEYSHPLGPTGKIYKQEELNNVRGASKFWVVYADREDVQTFKEAEEKTPFKKLNYMDAFYVSSTQNNGQMLQIVKFDPDPDAVDYDTKKLKNGFDPEKSYYGWVPAKYMMLWSSSLVDKSTKFIIKALTVHKPEALDNPSFYAEKNKVKLYNTPDLLPASRNDNVSTLFNFYYIYKEDEEKNSFLIGKNSEIDNPKDAGHEILGWVSKNVIQVWNKRLCLETNSDRQAINERSRKGIYPAVFRTKEEAENFEKGTPVDTNKVMKYFGVDYPFLNYTKRLPILAQDDKRPDIVQTAFITGIYNERNQEIASVDEHDDKEKQFNIKSHDARNVNLIFVLGGSANVKGYYSSISEGIKNASEKLHKAYQDNQFKYGCVVYNKSDDKKCNQDVLSQELSNNVGDVMDFITRNESKKVSCGDSKSPYYALHAGLKKACFLLSDHAKETNVLIVIGDIGSSDEESKAMDKDVIAKIHAFECGLLVYHVNNPGNSKPHDNFYRQIVRIAKTANEEINKNYKSLATQMPQLEQKPSGNAWSIYEFDPQTSALFGRLKFAIKQQLDPADISDDVNRTVMRVNESIDNKIANVEDYITGAGEKVKNINPSMALFLKGMGYDLNDPKFLAQLSGNSFQFCIPGYLSIRTDSAKNDIFNYNVFVTAAEYFNIKKLMDDVVSISNNSSGDLREKLKILFRETVKEYLGGIESNAMIDKMTPDSIMYFVTGIHTKSEIFKKYTIKSFDSPKTFTQNDMIKLTDVIREKRDMLRNIEVDQVHKFEMDRHIFYWIPDEYLP